MTSTNRNNIRKDLSSTLKSNSHPLPVNNPFNHELPEHMAAYERCLQVEALDQWSLLATDLQWDESEEMMLEMSPQFSARVLGFGMIHAPSPEGKRRLANEINGCGDDLEMFTGLAYLYVFGLIRICE